MNVSWWCSAQTGPWSWEPQYYPGIWVAMVALLVGYIYVVRFFGPTKVKPGEPICSRAQVVSFSAGYLMLWLVTDWPIGTLAAGYLLTAHMLQYILYSLVIAPLLIHGCPPWMRELILDAKLLQWVRWLVERPLQAFILFNGVLALTHIPFIADTLKPLQFGSMLMDIVWLGAALIFWTAIEGAEKYTAPSVANARRVLYIIGITILPTIPGAFLVFSNFPIYTTFEFATRAIEDFSAKDDQVLAGLLMWVAMMPILLVRLAVAFFSWSAAESKRSGQV